MNWSRIVPGAVIAVAVIYLGMAMTAPEGSRGKMDLDAFAKVPVVAAGRVKPMDTVARTTLMIISKRQTFKDANDESQPALRWLLDAMVSELQPRSERPAWEYKVFRVENDDLISFMGVEPRPGSYRYSFNELRPAFAKLERLTEPLRDPSVDAKQLDAFERQALELRRNLGLFLEVAKWKEPLIIPSRSADAEWKSYSDLLAESFRLALARVRAAEGAGGLSDEELRARFRVESLRILATDYPAAEAWHRILVAYRDGKQDAFNQAVADFRKHQGDLPPAADKAGYEVFFNRFAPFYHCAALYVFVFVLACAAWLAYPRELNQAAFWLTLVTLAVHTWALLSRMYLQGRPPVTNLYSSAVFIGWGCVGLGLTLEWLYRNGIGNVVAGVTGGLTVLIAHHLATTSGDTLQMMQAVLDTNFWLATHVTIITLGYSATFLAGFLGILFIVLGVFTTRLDRDLFKSLSQMIYGVLCFALFLSFVGTVLGGIWADQSWGRFWGWDPKENGALLIVLMNALILHARWAGMVKQRGMAVLAIVGNMITGWSWFGTNQLGVGLHSYGFSDTLAFRLMIFWVSQLAFIGLGLIPPGRWTSFGIVKPDPGPPPKLKGKGRRGVHVAPAHR